MQKLLRMGALAGLLATFAFAENYAGRLMDANCVDQNKSKACDPTNQTTAFVLVVDGKTYHLDDEGNGKAVTALKNRSDRQKDPSTPSNVVNAKVSGMQEGDDLRVDMIK